MNELISNELPEEFASIANVLQLDAQLLGDYSIKAVNGRQLQEALSSTKDHTTWAKKQIIRLGLVQGEDYEILSILGSPYGGSREISLKKAIPQNLMQTYCFTIEAAKTISMVSEASNGVVVRKYFLHMEKVAQQAYRGELPAQIISQPQSLEAKAMQETAQMSSAMFELVEKLWSRGYAQKMTHEISIDVDKRYGTDTTKFLPLPDSEGEYETTDRSEGAWYKRDIFGTVMKNTTEMAEFFGVNNVTAFNKAMVALGYAIPMKASRRNVSGYKSTPEKEDYAIRQKLNSGYFAGDEKITSWVLSKFTENERIRIKNWLRTYYPQHMIDNENKNKENI